MEDPLKFYTKIQDLIRNEARQVATQVYNELGTKYNVAEVPAHTHNGVDSNQIPYKNIVQGNKYTTVIQADASETVTIGGISNPTRIVFQGFAANNADGTPATKRTIINGEINFGQGFVFSDLTPPITVTTSGSGIPFVQSSNSMYIDSADLAKNRVSASQQDFIYALDDTSTVIARATAITYNNQLGLLTITFVVGTNWKIQGTFTIT